MFVVAVTFEVKPDHVDEFQKAMLQQATNSLDLEPGCQQFDVCFDPDRTGMCFLYEKYDDRHAFDVHLASDHFKNFDQLVEPWLSNREVSLWQAEPSKRTKDKS